MKLRESNGGFPEPPEGDPVRVVRTGHSACGGETRIRLSGYVPARAVRRVVCEHCEQSFVCDPVEEVEQLMGTVPSVPVVATTEPSEALGTEGTVPVDVDPPEAAEGSGTPVPPAPAPRRLPRPRLPEAGSPLWRWVGIPVAALAVIAALLFLQGEDAPEPSAPVTAPPPGSTPAGGDTADSTETRFVSQPGFSLALPPGWEQTPAEGGAAFTAATIRGDGDATLWIERAPDLTFSEFEARSLEQLTSLAGEAEVVERILGSKESQTVVRLRADAPDESGVSAPYDVTLRAAGPFRYYLATTVQPEASRQAVEGADLIHGSFVPEPDGSGEVAAGGTPGGEETE